MIIISVKIYFSKYRTRTWGSAPPPYIMKQYVHEFEAALAPL